MISEAIQRWVDNCSKVLITPRVNNLTNYILNHFSAVSQARALAFAWLQ